MEIEIAVQGLHSLKYLDIPIDSNNLYEKHFQETLRIIRNMCKVIASKKPQDMRNLSPGEKHGDVSWISWPMVP